MKISNERRTIVGLHYVRALATLMVVFYHVDTIGSHEKYFGHHAFGGILQYPAGEIDLFFLMSGLIMIISTHDRFTMKPRISASEFLLRRVIRIIPLLWISAVLFCAAIFLMRPSRDFDFSPYIRTFFIWPLDSVLPFTAWTIRYEVLFYLIFAASFLWLPRLKWLGAIWFISSIVLTAFGMQSLDEADSLLHFIFSPFNMEFGLGVLLGYLYFRHQAVYPVKNQLLIVITSVLIIRFFIAEFFHSTVHANDFYHAAALAPACLAIIAFALWTNPKNVSPRMMYFGDASYSIFLFHPLVVSPMLAAFKALMPWLPFEAVVLVTGCIGVALGCIIHVWVEKPLVKIANARFLPAIKARHQVAA